MGLAPVTLVLRTVPSRYGRLLGRALHSRPARVIAHPVTALVLNSGGFAVLHFSPLHVAASSNPALQHVVHLHFLLALALVVTWRPRRTTITPHDPVEQRRFS